MRRFVLEQIVSTLITLAIFLGAFTIFDVWQESLDARLAAMSITFIVGYAAVILLRLLVLARDWNRPIDVAFTAVAIAIIALMGWWGAIFAILVISAWSIAVIAVMIKWQKGVAAADQRWFWQRPHVLLWMQFLVTWVLLGWLARF